METAEVPRVLLYDDNSEQLRILERLLSRRGFNVTTVSSPSELIDAAIRFIPAIILFDVQVPEISSSELIGALRGLAELRGTRLLLFSACDFELLHRMTKETGADGWLQKTFDGDELAQRLREILDGA